MSTSRKPLPQQNHSLKSNGFKLIAALLLFTLGLVSAGYFYRQITQAEAQFPPPVTDIPLSADKRYGVNIDLTQYSEAELVQALEAMQEAGIVWVRQPINWAEIEPEPGAYNWTALDNALSIARLRGIEVIGVLQTSPAWARAENSGPNTPPNEALDFGKFARQVALHFQDDISAYQIWHEPNLSQNWGNRNINPAEYVNLLKNAALNIRAVNPQALILSASLAPTTEASLLNLNEADYLQQMYQANAAPWFDVLGGQLYGFHLPVEPITADPNLLNIHRITLLRQVMEANGDESKAIWATAFGWNALPANWAGQPPAWPSDVPQKQAQRTAEAITYARANWPWLGPMLAVRWDDKGLAPDDPALGFAIYPALLAPFSEAQRLPYTATVGSYPAPHWSGQYSFGWQYAADRVDIPRHTPGAEDAPTLTIPFEGTRLDLNIERGDYQGYLWVTVDGKPANALPHDEKGQSYVVLQDPLAKEDTVTLARNLSDGPHTAIITAEGGWGQWAILGWQVQREADTRRAMQGLALSLLLALPGFILLLGLGLQNRRALEQSILGLWAWLGKVYHRLGYPLQIGLTLALVLGAVWLPGLFALLALALLGLTFLLHLEMGLMVISFAMSFFLLKKPLPVGTFSLFELLLLILVLATGLRLFLPPPNNPTHSLPLKTLWKMNWLNGTDWAVILLVILATLTTFTAQLIGVAMFELRTLVIEGALFYFAIRLRPHLEEEDEARFAQRLIDAFVAGAVVHAASALFQYVSAPEQTITAEGVRRAIGYVYGSPNNLALFLERAFPLLLAMTVFGKDKPRRLSYGLGLILVSAALLFTFSKGALLLAIPAVIIFFILMRGGKYAWMGGGLGLILFALALIPLSRLERFQNTFSLQPGTTAYIRLKVWQSAWQMLQENPITGLGLDNFLYQYRTRYILPTAWAEPDLSHPHNHLLDFGARLGVGGIFVFLWLQWQFWRKALKGYFRHFDTSVAVLLLGLMGSMITFLAHGLVDNSFFLVDLAFAFFLSLGLVEVIAESNS